MPRRAGVVPTLPGLIRTTTGLRRNLVALIKRFPEDHLDLEERIFVRLLNPLWRNPYGQEYSSGQQKQIEVVKWIESYQSYIRDLEGLLCGVLNKPDVFRTLPLHELPLHPTAQFSGDECLRRLTLQNAALLRLGTEDRALISRVDGPLEDLRTGLRGAIRKLGLKECAVATGLDRETLSAFATGRIQKPQRKTVDQLVKYLT